VRADLCLANLNPDLQQLFSLTKLDALFRIDNSDGGDLAGRTAPLTPRAPRPRAQGMEKSLPSGEASPSERRSDDAVGGWSRSSST
jgi:hypothetical protein